MPSRRALLFGRRQERPAAGPAAPVASIGSNCLAMRGIACMTCRDACMPGAIRFVLARGGAQPRVEADLCTGCSDCVAVCPSSSIAVAGVALDIGDAHG